MGELIQIAGPAELAQSNYNAYREWALTNSTDTPLPTWPQLPPDVQSAWVAQSLGVRQPRQPDPVPAEQNPLPTPRLQLPARNAMEYVYFIRAETGHIKIGVSGIPAARIVALKTASPVPLELVGMLGSRNARGLEARLHRRFADLRSHGEWFRPGEKLLAYIASLPLIA